jgi:hypothetical protein
MVYRRLQTILMALMLGALAAPAHAQGKPDPKGGKPDPKAEEQLKLTKPQTAQLEELAKLVDEVLTGKTPAAADVKLSFQNHFVRSSTNVFVPYVLEIGGGKFTSFPVALYVRALRKGAATDKPAEPAFTDIHFLQNAGSLTSTGNEAAQLARALELPAGEFDVYFAMTETPARNSKTPPKRVVHQQSLTVPDLSASLTTSSIILAKNFEDAPQQLTARQQMEQPYTIGGQKITPSFTSSFSKAGELLFLFLVYNEGVTPAGKPDLDVGFTLTRGNETKPFAKMPTASFNASTLPAEFSLSAGHQVLVAQGLPLASLAPGEYKLAIGITDKTSNQTITRDVPFTVTP